MSGHVDLAEFVSAYIAEAEELLGVANAQLLVVDEALRKGYPAARAVRELFRALHTIKGLSAMVGIEPVVAISHRMEATLRTADRGGGAISPAAIDVLLSGVRAIELRVRALADGRPVPPPATSLIDALEALDVTHAPALAPAGPPSLSLEPAIAAKLAPFELEQLSRGAMAGKRAIRLDFAPSPERAARGLTINTVRERVSKIGEIVKVVPISVPATGAAPGGLAFALLVLSETSDAALAEAGGVEVSALRVIAESAPAPDAALDVTQTDAPGAALEGDSLLPDDDDVDETGPQARNVVRVEVSRLDDAMERLAALVVTRFRLSREVAALQAAGANVRALSQVVAEQSRQLRDLRAAIVRVRMVPVSDVLERVPLVVRALRRETGKRVRLDVNAGRAELDKAVAERVFPAVIHLVRNAMDHAIETPGERSALGKPEEAVLTISASARSSRHLELVISDDGRGVDREAVARRAGRDTPKSDAALLEMLCAPGFSTADRTTTTSGRGMGMDIVKRIVVDQLGGELVMATVPGKGTTFTLRVPLTVSIVDAFAFECATHRFVVPLAMIDEIMDVEPGGQVHGPSPNGGNASMIERRGQAVPLLDLESIFALVRPSGSVPPAGRKALIVRRSGEPMAFAVDRMLGQQEVVVRPLEDPMIRVPGVSGATDLGDGRPTLVLDLVALGASLSSGGAG